MAHLTLYLQRGELSLSSDALARATITRPTETHAACTTQVFNKAPRVYHCTSRSKNIRVRATHGTSQPALVVVGSVNADMVLEVERLPAEGETLAAKTLQTFPGGKGANQAAAAGKLGCKTYFLGQVGKDNNADFLKSSLADAGVDLTHLRRVDGPSGTAAILLQPSGENSIIIVGGANTSNWKIEDAARQVLQSAGGLLLQREIPEDINTEAAKMASEAGVRVIMDCGGVEGPISEDLLQNVTILSPNETELARLTELPTDSKEDVSTAARRLLEKGVREAVLVKRGGKGSLLVTANDSVEQDIFKTDKVVDTTGAGDCFTGAYAVAVLEGLQASRALQFASAAASLCVQKQGAMTSLPTREEVDALIRSVS